MPENSNPTSDKRKLSGVLLIIVPIIMFAIFLVFSLLNYKGMELGALVLIPIGILLGLLVLIGLVLGLILIVSSKQENKFYIKEAVKFGYEKMKENFWFFVGIIIIYSIISFIPTIFFDTKGIPDQDNTIYKAIPALFMVIVWVAQIIINIGLLKISLLVVDGKEKKFSDLFSGASLFFNFLIASIIYGIIVMVGFILFIIPGIIWQVKFSMFPYFIIEGYGPIESLKKSSQITYGSKANIFLLSLLFAAINLLGAMILLIGLLVTMPISIIGTAYVYRKLSGSNQNI